jgi:hypothetical protein
MCILHHLMLRVDVMCLTNRNMNFTLFILPIVMPRCNYPIHGCWTWSLIIHNTLQLLLKRRAACILMQRLTWNQVEIWSTLCIDDILIQISLWHTNDTRRIVLMPIVLLWVLLLLVHQLLLLCICKDWLLRYLCIIPMVYHLSNHNIRESCFTGWNHFILVITPIVIVNFFNLFFLLLILIALLFFLNLLPRFLNGTWTLLRHRHRHYDWTCVTLLLWLHLKLLLLLFFIRIIERWIRIIHLLLLSRRLLLKSWWFNSQFLLKVTILILFNIVLIYQLNLLFQNIFAVLNHFILFTLLVLFLSTNIGLLLGMGVLHHLVEYSGACFLLVVIAWAGLHNLSLIGAHWVFVTAGVLDLVLHIFLSIFHCRRLFLKFYYI